MSKYRVRIEDRVYEVEVEKIDADQVKHHEQDEQDSIKHESVLQSISDGTQVKAPLAGTIMSVRTKIGQKIQKGDVLLTLEALKLENEITAPVSGTVVEIVSEGESVEMDQIIAIIN